MAIQNVFEIDVDIKQKTAIRTPTVTQNDAVVFTFRVFDEGRIYNIQEGTAFTMTCIRADKQSVVTAGTVKTANVVEFKLGTTEISVEGKVQAVIQVYDVNGRVSTIPFNFTVLKDPTKDYIPSTEEKTLIQQVLGEGPAVIEGAKTATDNANTAAQGANTAKEAAEAATQNANTAASNANQSATIAEEKATLAGQKAIEANAAAEGANTAKLGAETATQDAQQATDAINLVLPNVLNLEFMAPYNATTQYFKNNIVRQGKNSYIALQDTLGNEPTGTTDSPFWGVLAIGGLDGAGSVVTVNGESPDENGNVTITIPNPDLSGLATKQELTDVNETVARHLADEVKHLTTADKNKLNSAILEHEAAPNNDLNDTVLSGIYKTVNATLNTPGLGGSGSMVIVTVYNSDNQEQIYIGRTGNNLFFRRKTVGVWQPWVEVWHGGNTGSGTDYTTKRPRNIAFKTSDFTTAELSNGEIGLVY